MPKSTYYGINFVNFRGLFCEIALACILKKISQNLKLVKWLNLKLKLKILGILTLVA